MVKKLITTYSKKYDELILKYRDGNAIEYVVKPYKNYFFKRDNFGEFVHILDNEIKCVKVYDRRDAEFEVDTNVIDRFYINDAEDMMTHLENNDVKLLYYDIETNASLDIEARESILSIAFTTNYSSKINVLIWQPVEKSSVERDETKNIYIFPTEREMLSVFIKVLKSVDVIIGFNSKRFDDPYLVNRCINLGLVDELKLFNDVKCFKKEHSGQDNSWVIYSDYYFIDARDLLIELFQCSADIEKPAQFSLNEISKVLLNDTKVQNVNIVDSWKNNYKLHCEYVAQDVALLKRLCDTTKIINQLINKVNFAKIPLNKAFVNSYIIDLLIRRKNKEFVFPSKIKHTEISDDILTGAIVFEPKDGLYKNVGVFDFSAMYPNTILAYDISPDKNKKILPELIRNLMQLRQNYKQAQKDATTEVEKQMLRANEMVIKTLISSCYGVFGYKGFRLYSLDVANQITSHSRDLLLATTKYIEDELKLKVIYGDTDSFFVVFPDDNKEFITETVDKVNNFVQTTISKYYKLECETIFKFLILPPSKKTYIGLVDYVKNKKLDKIKIYMKGFQLLRRDTPNFFKNTIKNKTLQLLIELMNGNNTFETFVKSLECELKAQTDIKQLMIAKQISKELDDYKVIPQHVKAMKYSNAVLGCNFNRQNYVGGLVYVKNNSHTDAIMLDFDKEYKIENGCIIINNKINEIDYDKYLDIFILSKFKKLNVCFEYMAGQKTMSTWF